MPVDGRGFCSLFIRLRAGTAPAAATCVAGREALKLEAPPVGGGAASDCTAAGFHVCHQRPHPVSSHPPYFFATVSALETYSFLLLPLSLPSFRKAPWLDLVAPLPRPGLLAQTPVPLPLRVPSRVKSCYPINSYVPHHICSLNRNVSPRPGVGEGTGSGSWIGRGRGWEEGVLGEVSTCAQIQEACRPCSRRCLHAHVDGASPVGQGT